MHNYLNRELRNYRDFLQGNVKFFMHAYLEMFLGYGLSGRQCNKPEKILHLSAREEVDRKNDLTGLKKTTKEGMPEWLATLNRYNDPSIEDVWQL